MFPICSGTKLKFYNFSMRWIFIYLEQARLEKQRHLYPKKPSAQRCSSSYLWPMMQVNPANFKLGLAMYGCYMMLFCLLFYNKVLYMYMYTQVYTHTHAHTHTHIDIYRYI